MAHECSVWSEPNNIAEKPSVIVVAGPRACGKTYLISLDLLERLNKRCKQVHFFSPLEEEYIHYSLSDIDVKRHSWSLQQCNNTFSEMQKSDQPSLMILDDDAEDMMRQSRGAGHNSIYRSLFLSGRSSDITSLISLQSVQGLDRGFLSNIDYMFVHSQILSTTTILNRLYKAFGLDRTYSSCEELSRTLKRFLDENVHTFVVFCRSKGSNLPTKVFLYKAQNLRRTRQAVCLCERLWLGVLARRRLQRLRLGRHIELLPGRGCVYEQCAERFDTFKKK